MRNLSLYKRLKEYCEIAIAFLEEKVAKNQGLPSTVKVKFECAEDGGYSYTYVPEILWYMLVGRNEQELKQMEIHQSAVQVLRDDLEIARHLDNLVGTEEFRLRLDADTCLRSLLIKLLQEQQGLTFREAIFDKVYEEFEEYFYRDMVEYRFMSPLSNFQTEIEKIELSPGFAIIKIPREERERMLSHSSEPGLFPLYQVMPFNIYAFEFYLKAPKLFGESHSVREVKKIPSQIARKQFDEACSALRLFKKGAVNYEYIRVGTTSWELHGGTFTTATIERRQSIGVQYVLSKDELPDFLRFWNFFQKARRKTRRRIDVALRRLNFAYGRTRSEDKLIDYMIGFEALLLEGERQELEYRLALRGSTLLGKTSEERKKIFEELKTAYRERSSIVHGGVLKEIVKIGNHEVKFSEFVDKVGQILCLAIKEFLRLTENKGESAVINELDGKIIGGLKPEKFEA